VQTKDGVNWTHDVFAKDGRTLLFTLWGFVTPTELVIERMTPDGTLDVLAKLPYREAETFLVRKRLVKGADGVMAYQSVTA
jgi:hypothetical protein